MSGPATHVVSYDADTYELTFTCTGDQSADCHNYPDGEEWGPDTPRDRFKPQEECWLAPWFENDAVEYCGEDAGLNPAPGYASNTTPTITRSGPVDVTYMQDCVEWSWKGDEA